MKSLFKIIIFLFSHEINLDVPECINNTTMTIMCEHIFSFFPLSLYSHISFKRTHTGSPDKTNVFSLRVLNFIKKISYLQDRKVTHGNWQYNLLILVLLAFLLIFTRIFFIHFTIRLTSKCTFLAVY